MQPIIGTVSLGAAFLAVAASIVTAIVLSLRLRRVRNDFASAKQTFVRNKAIVDASGEGVLELDDEGRVQYANPAAVRMLGYEAEELLGRNYLEFMSAGAEDLGRKRMGQVGHTTGMVHGVGAILRCKNGRHRPVEYKMVPVAHDQIRALGSVIAFRDLTERVRADLMLADMQYTAKVGAWELIVQNNVLNVTEAVSHHLGLPAGRPMTSRQLLERCESIDARRLNEAAREAIIKGASFDLELQLTDGTAVRCIGKAERVDGRTLRLYGAIQDITDRKSAERVLRETRDFFGATLDAMPSLVMHIDHTRRVTYCNRSPLRALLVCKEPVVGEPVEVALGPHQYADMQANIAGALNDQAYSEVRALTRDGESRDVQLNFVPEPHPGQQGRGCFIVLTDVTELKSLEARLRQAEKMQVIGQLTGGVAHDFNNLLGVILGNLQLMERDIGKEPALSKKLTTAMRAAMRGGDLTRRLLAFARRQILDPAIVDLKRQLANFSDLVQRTLGESIETQMIFAPDLWSVRIDPGQMESAILNLAINARDAMPAGGRLTIEARNLRLPGDSTQKVIDLAPGDYVAVSVTDTGAGIPPELLSRVFDPFFTTKESGKGSGLGLSIVQGFAKQSGGTATIASEVGRGTTVSLFLPRCVEVEPAHEDTIVFKKMPGGDETILVVEDDSDLRATVMLALQQLGYKVLEAFNGEAALRVLRGPERVDLLFTDIMMPGGLLGTGLAQRARQIDPRIRVLFTTGYAGDAVPLGGAVAADEIIAKPYRNEELALKIRNLLDEETQVV